MCTAFSLLQRTAVFPPCFIEEACGLCIIFFLGARSGWMPVLHKSGTAHLQIYLKILAGRWVSAASAPTPEACALRAADKDSIDAPHGAPMQSVAAGNAFRELAASPCRNENKAYYKKILCINQAGSMLSGLFFCKDGAETFFMYSIRREVHAAMWRPAVRHTFRYTFWTPFFLKR